MRNKKPRKIIIEGEEYSWKVKADEDYGRIITVCKKHTKLFVIPSTDINITPNLIAERIKKHLS